MKGTVRFKCGHEGCNEFAIYDTYDRKHSIELQKRYGNGKWRCSRHSHPEEVLSLTNLSRTKVLTAFKEPSGLYWGQEKGSSGFTFGPGFKAYADDFPEGTIIEIIATIRLPK